MRGEFEVPVGLCEGYVKQGERIGIPVESLQSAGPANEVLVVDGLGVVTCAME